MPELLPGFVICVMPVIFVLIAIVITLVQRRHIVQSRPRRRMEARKALDECIHQIAAEFPAEVRVWGGTNVLYEMQVVESLLRDLREPDAASPSTETVPGHLEPAVASRTAPTLDPTAVVADDSPHQAQLLVYLKRLDQCYADLAENEDLPASPWPSPYLRRWITVRRARREPNELIELIGTAFPQQLRVWGGKDTLRDSDKVRELLQGMAGTPVCPPTARAVARALPDASARLCLAYTLRDIRKKQTAAVWLRRTQGVMLLLASAVRFYPALGVGAVGYLAVWQSYGFDGRTYWGHNQLRDRANLLGFIVAAPVGAIAFLLMLRLLFVWYRRVVGRRQQRLTDAILAVPASDPAAVGALGDVTLLRRASFTQNLLRELESA